LLLDLFGLGFFSFIDISTFCTESLGFSGFSTRSASGSLFFFDFATFFFIEEFFLSRFATSFPGILTAFSSIALNLAFLLPDRFGLDTFASFVEVSTSFTRSLGFSDSKSPTTVASVLLLWPVALCVFFLKEEFFLSRFDTSFPGILTAFSSMALNFAFLLFVLFGFDTFVSLVDIPSFFTVSLGFSEFATIIFSGLLISSFVTATLFLLEEFFLSRFATLFPGSFTAFSSMALNFAFLLPDFFGWDTFFSLVDVSTFCRGSLDFSGIFVTVVSGLLDSIFGFSVFFLNDEFFRLSFSVSFPGNLSAFSSIALNFAF